MLTSKVEKITLGLLLPLAVVGNMGVVEAVASWFEQDAAIGWLLGPGLVAGILYVAFALHDEDGEEDSDEDGDQDSDQDGDQDGDEADLAG